MSDELPDFKPVVLPGNDAPDDSDDPSTLEQDEEVNGAEDAPVEDAPADDSAQGSHASDSDSDPDKASDTAPATASDETEGEQEQEESQMGVLDHFMELRRCLTRIVLAVLIGFMPCYAVAEKLFAILMEPMNEAISKVSGSSAMALTPEFFAALKETLVLGLGDRGPEFAEQTAYFIAALETALQKVVINQGQFIYTYPPEAFFAEVKVAFVAGFFLVSPYIFLQFWKFVAPGLYPHERKWIWPIALVSALFFVSGACFGYFVVFPVGFEFFAQFSSESISFMPKLSEYLGFALKLLIAFGVAFELPVFIFFLAVMGLVTGKWLLTKGKYFILIAFIIGAALTPPDPVSQSLMAGPLILLYGLGVIIAFIFGRKPKKKEPEEEAGEAA